MMVMVAAGYWVLTVSSLPLEITYFDSVMVVPGELALCAVLARMELDAVVVLNEVSRIDSESVPTALDDEAETDESSMIEIKPELEKTDVLSMVLDTDVGASVEDDKVVFEELDTPGSVAKGGLMMPVADPEEAVGVAWLGYTELRDSRHVLNNVDVS